MDQNDTLVNMTASEEADDKIDIKCGRSLQVNVIFEGFLNDVSKMAAFGAIAVIIFSLVMLAFHRTVKPILRLLDLITDFGEISDLERCAVFINKVFQGDAVKTQVAIMQIEAFLWKIICLLNEVKVTVLHS